MFLRFQQAIKPFFLGTRTQEKYIHPLFLRLKYFRDTLDTSFWFLVTMDEGTRKAVDSFFFNVFTKLRQRYKGDFFFFKKFRSSWFLSLKGKLQNSFAAFVPKLKFSFEFVYTFFLIVFVYIF